MTREELQALYPDGVRNKNIRNFSNANDKKVRMVAAYFGWEQFATINQALEIGLDMLIQQMTEVSIVEG